MTGRPEPEPSDRSARQAAADLLGAVLLGLFSVLWVAGHHSFSGPTIYSFRGQTHGIHLLDLMVVPFLAVAAALLVRAVRLPRPWE